MDRNSSNRLSALALISSVMFAVAGCTKSPDEVEKSAASHLAAAEPRSAMVELKDLLQREPGRPLSRVLLAKALMAMSDYPGAENELRHAAKLGVAADELAVPLARSLVYQGRFDTLLDDTVLAAAKDPTVRAEVLSLKGGALIALGRPDEADTVLAEAAGLAPQLGMPRAAQALLRLQQGRLDEAGTILAEAAKLDSQSAEVQRALGAYYATRRRPADAAQAFGKAAELAASGPRADRELRYGALAGLASVELEAQRLAGAKAALEQLDRMGKRRINVLLHARIDLLEGRLAEARQGLEPLLSGGQSDPEASLLLGIVLLQQGNRGQAETSLGDVLREAPNNFIARQVLAQIRLSEGKPKEALAALQPILNEASGNVVTLAVQASLAAGDRPGALAMLDQGAGKNLVSSDKAADLARGYLLANDSAKALEVISRAEPGAGGTATLDGLKLAAFLSRNDLAGAKAAAAEIARGSPEDAAVQVMLGDFHARTGDLDLARAALERAQHLSPKDASIPARLARLDVAAGKPARAEERLAAAAEASPEAAGPYAAMAELKAGRGDLPGALADLDKAQSLSPGDASLKLAAARVKLAQGNTTGAVESSAAAVALNPKNVQLLTGHATILLAAKRGPEALSLLQRAIKDQPDDAQLRLLLAGVLAATDDLVGAVASAREATRLNPRSARALAALGELQVRKGDLAAVRDTVTRIQAIESPSAAALLLEAGVATREKRYSDAAEAIAAANRIAPDPALVLREFAVRRQAGLPAPAQPLEAWLDKNPNDVGVRLALGDYRMSLNNSSAAISDYEKVIALQPRNLVALNNAAWIEASRGNLRRALELAERAHSVVPRDFSVIDTYGWVLSLNGQHQRAVELLGDARKREGAIPDIDYHYALALYELGRRDEAVTVLTTLAEKPEPFASRDVAKKLLANILEKGT